VDHRRLCVELQSVCLERVSLCAGRARLERRERLTLQGRAAGTTTRRTVSQSAGRRGRDPPRSETGRTCRQGRQRNPGSATRAGPCSESHHRPGSSSHVSARPAMISGGRPSVTHDDVVAAGILEHASDELGRDGCAALVLLVLPGVRKVGDDGSDALGRRNLASMDQNQELHKAARREWGQAADERRARQSDVDQRDRKQRQSGAVSQRPATSSRPGA
jgi:hypothetical protein